MFRLPLSSTHRDPAAGSPGPGRGPDHPGRGLHPRAHPLALTLLTGLLALLAAVLLSACAAPPAPGSDRATLLRERGTPTAMHALPGGGQRLEFASGPFGRETWMVDLDAQGRVLAARQVLTDAELAAVQAAPELQADALLRWIGTPAERRAGGVAGGQVWSWRYATNDCLWFQASVADDGRVGGRSFAIDPHCDAGNDRL